MGIPCGRRGMAKKKKGEQEKKGGKAGKGGKQTPNKTPHKKDVVQPSMEVSSPGKATGGHDRTKWAGSATLGVAPAPEDLPLPRFVLRRQGGADGAAAAGAAPLAKGAGATSTSGAPGSGAPGSGPKLRRVGDAKEMTVEAHDLVPFFDAAALGTEKRMEDMAVNDGLRAVPTNLPPDASVQVREWTEDGYFQNATVKQVNVRAEGAGQAVPRNYSEPEPAEVPRNYPDPAAAPTVVPRNYAEPPAQTVPRNYAEGGAQAVPRNYAEPGVQAVPRNYAEGTVPGPPPGRPTPGQQLGAAPLNAAGLAAAGW